MEAHGPTRTLEVSVVTVTQVRGILRAAAQEWISADLASVYGLLGPHLRSLKPSMTTGVKFANASKLRL